MKSRRHAVQLSGRSNVQRGDRQTVQDDQDLADAVQPKPGLPRTVPAVKVQAQVFRAKLKQYLDGEQPVIVGDHYSPRAMLIPFRFDGHRVYSISPSQRAEIMRRVETALDALER